MKIIEILIKVNITAKRAINIRDFIINSSKGKTVICQPGIMLVEKFKFVSSKLVSSRITVFAIAVINNDKILITMFFFIIEYHLDRLSPHTFRLSSRID